MLRTVQINILRPEMSSLSNRFSRLSTNERWIAAVVAAGAAAAIAFSLVRRSRADPAPAADLAAAGAAAGLTRLSPRDAAAAADVLAEALALDPLFTACSAEVRFRGALGCGGARGAWAQLRSAAFPRRPRRARPPRRLVCPRTDERGSLSPPAPAAPRTAAAAPPRATSSKRHATAA